MSETVASPLKRSRNEAVELIEQVRRRPCLWQRACAAYRDRGAKEQAWQEVCRALEPGYNDMAPAGRHEIGNYPRTATAAPRSRPGRRCVARWSPATTTWRPQSGMRSAWQEVCRALEPGYNDMAPAGRHEIGNYPRTATAAPRSRPGRRCVAHWSPATTTWRPQAGMRSVTTLVPRPRRQGAGLAGGVSRAGAQLRRHGARRQHEIGLVMMRKWYNIRDAFKKYYSSKGNAAHSSRPYVYADRLAFLIPLFERKREPARCEREPVKCERVDDEQEEQEEWLSVFDLEPTDVSPPKRTKTELEYPRSKEAEPDDSIVSILVNLIAKEDDEDRAFFKSITPTVKSLPEQAKFLFRIQVMKLLSKLKQNSKSVKNDSNTDGSDTE
ncbi:Dihydrouridine synthase domain containing protein [Operophtera brumata]|uniref:Dihydrouridine synthase domain containing protein n=1 Tax=Operophtera brumata TaxID=104452 RepID=A0A0L7KTV1_OPEBR|nr:Dihydrouridine synthase domain containing protein [Operophtera brumata]